MSANEFQEFCDNDYELEEETEEFSLEYSLLAY